MYKKILAALLLCSSLLAGPARAQDCTPPPIPAPAKSENLFTPEQEMILGDLTIQRIARDMRFVRDERLVAYVRDIGDRIARHLPPTGLRFQYHIIDIPEANAFNLPGGHVLLSRKLIAFVNSEDELAGVIAHEFGHAVMRHVAVDMTRSLKTVLNVTDLGDRKDITEKYNLLIERARTKQVPRGRGHEDAQQLEADKTGLLAMAAAGYDPSAFISAFARLTENKVKGGGGWFSDLFGRKTPEQKQIREALRAAEKLPPACRQGRAARVTEEFLKWQAEVVSFREAARREELPGLLWKKELSPKLRSDVSHFAFSDDGRFLLAQDDYSVTILKREPLSVLFQIPVEGAAEASFTPDGESVVFTTDNLRYEKWSVAERKPVEVRELVTQYDCRERKLSPDGNHLACVDPAANLNLFEMRTGRKVWDKKQFYRFSFFEYLAWVADLKGADGEDTNFFRIEFTPDARHVVFSRSERFRERFTGMSYMGSEDASLALDLQTMKIVELGGDLKRLTAHAYAFLEPDKVIGMAGNTVEDGGVYSFPAGRRLQKFRFGAKRVKRTAGAGHVLVKPFRKLKLGVFDVKRGFITFGVDKEDLTLWNNVVAYESDDGRVTLAEAGYSEATQKLEFKDVASAEIPVSSLKALEAAAVSDNFNWLLLSSKTRGGLWNLSTGERKIYVRGFRGGVLDNGGGAIGEFPAQDEVPHGLVLMKPSQNEVGLFRELPAKGARQYGRYVLTVIPTKEKKEEPAAADPSAAPTPIPFDPHYGAPPHEFRFELKDFIQDKVIWTRDFNTGMPRYSFDDSSGRLIFYWRLGSYAGKARLKELPELQAKADALGNKFGDYMIEVVDAFRQKTVGTLLVETGNGSFWVGHGVSDGDWVVLPDTEGRVLVYSLKDGELRHRFFGNHAAVNPRRNQIAVENFPGEVNLYDLDTGEPSSRLVINGTTAFTRFSADGGRLLLLNDTQTAYAFDLDKLAAPAPAAQVK